MNTYEIIILGCILISFPHLIEVLFLAYNKDYSKEQQDSFIDISLILSALIIMEFIGSASILLNIPLLISFITKRKISSILLSLIIISDYIILNTNLLIGIVEYVGYFILMYKILKNKEDYIKFYSFIIIKTLITILYLLSINTNLINIVSETIIFLIVVIFVYYLRLGASNIVRLHMHFKEIENEAQIKNSLFKITHEIKNPIAVCKGYLDMFDVNSEDHAIRYIPILKEEIEKTLMLLQDFLQMTNIKVNKDIIDVNMLLEEVADNYKLLLKSYNIKFQNNIIDDEVYIDGDYNRLMQVFLNIVKNSIEAIGSNGLIKVDTKLDKNYIHINISDNGSGISKEDLEKIKQPFYTTKKNGTGLGVSLAHEIIKSHSGVIKYTSKENVGTNVFIKLKLYKI